MSAAAQNGRLRAWFEILRLPNLLTVPGDPLAGFFLVGGASVGRLAVAAGTALLFYAAGLLLNDWFDRETDQRERPARPLPSGRISPRTVIGAAVALLVAGLACSLFLGLLGFGVALVLAGLVVAYDAGGKERSLLGPLLMGACRGGSLLLGAAAARPPPWPLPVGVAAGILWLYIYSVSRLARHEMEEGEVAEAEPGPALVLAAGGVFLAFLLARRTVLHSGWFLIPWLAVVAVTLPVAGLFSKRRGGKPAAIGRLLRALLPLQSFFLLAAGEWRTAAVLLLVLWPLSGILNKRFAMS